MEKGERKEEDPQYIPDCGAYLLSLLMDDEEELTTVVVSAVSAVTGIPVEEIKLNAGGLIPIRIAHCSAYLRSLISRPLQGECLDKLCQILCVSVTVTD